MNKEQTAAIIAGTVRVFCGAANPSALIRIAQRESGLNPKAVGDKTIAPKAFVKKQSYFQSVGNPWANKPERWAGSFGLFQMMPAYFLPLWDKEADPYVLFDPRVATVCAGRLWNRAVRMGARDFVGVRIVWAYGSLEHGPGSEPYEKRAADKWSVVNGVVNPSASAFQYTGFGTDPQPNQLQKLALITGTAPQVQPNPSLALPLLAAAAFGVWALAKGARA